MTIRDALTKLVYEAHSLVGWIETDGEMTPALRQAMKRRGQVAQTSELRATVDGTRYVFAGARTPSLPYDDLALYVFADGRFEEDDLILFSLVELPDGIVWHPIINIVHELPNGYETNGRYSIRAESELHGITIHHCACASVPNALSPTAIANFHVGPDRQWPGHAYTNQIQPDGTIYQTNAVTTISYHANVHNDMWLGILVNGHFDVEEPTPEAVSATRFLVWHYRQLYGQHLEVAGHGEMSHQTTQCPGRHLKRHLPHINGRMMIESAPSPILAEAIT